MEGHSLGLPLGLEAPIMTPDSVTFLFFSFLEGHKGMQGRPGTKSPVCTRSKNFISRLKLSWSEKNLQTTGVLLPLRLAENTKVLLPLIWPVSSTYLPAADHMHVPFYPW